MNLHVRHARFSARAVHAHGVEITLAMPRGVPAAARPLPAEAEVSFEHERQIVMLSGTLLSGFALGVRYQLAQRFAQVAG